MLVDLKSLALAKQPVQISLREEIHDTPFKIKISGALNENGHFRFEVVLEGTMGYCMPTYDYGGKIIFTVDEDGVLLEFNPKYFSCEEYWTSLTNYFYTGDTAVSMLMEDQDEFLGWFNLKRQSYPSDDLKDKLIEHREGKEKISDHQIVIENTIHDNPQIQFSLETQENPQKVKLSFTLEKYEDDLDCTKVLSGTLVYTFSQYDNRLTSVEVVEMVETFEEEIERFESDASRVSVWIEYTGYLEDFHEFFGISNKE